MSKLVFISGIFNVLHPGHFRLFKFASEIGTRLVVGVLNDDVLDNRFNHQSERLDALNAISLIDEVVLVSDLEVTLNHLKPDIVVKGSEFRNQDNLEESILAKWQGKLVFSAGVSQFSIPQKNNGEGSRPYPNSYVSFVQRHQIDIRKIIDGLDRIKTLKVAVIGDIILDEYIDCAPVGLSREDPTIVVSPKSKEQFIGGAAIVAAHTRSFGASVDFYSVSGADEKAEWVKSQMNEYGVNCFVYEDDSRPTTCKTRYRSSNKSLLRVNEFRTHGLQGQIQKSFLNELEANIANYDLIVFSDFSYGVLTRDFAHKIQTIAKSNNIPMIADSQTSSQRGDLGKFENLMLTTPTEIEARLAVDIEDSDIGLAYVIESLAKRLKSKNVMVTLGADGVLILDATDIGNCKIDSLPALNKNPMDVAGAGDLVLISSGLLQVTGCDVWHAGLLSMVAASLHVSRVGNTPIKMDELKVTLTQLDTRNS